MNQLLLLSYGVGPHVAETQSAIMSAFRHDGPVPRGYAVVVVTDMPAQFDGLPVRVEAVLPEQLRAWAGPAAFNHRIKILAVRHVMGRHGGRTVLVDGDTYFRRPPAELFDRVGPGRSLMHVREGTIGARAALGYDRHRLAGMTHDLGAVGRYEFDPRTPIWNAGVIGLDPADANRLDDVLALTDAIHAAVPTKISEQLAFSSILGRHTRLSGCRDLVYHYHPPVVRNPFRTRLPDALRDTADLPLPERALQLYDVRPTAPWSKMLKASVKRCGRVVGLFQHDLETSV